MDRNFLRNISLDIILESKIAMFVVTIFDKFGTFELLQ